MRLQGPARLTLVSSSHHIHIIIQLLAPKLFGTVGQLLLTRNADFFIQEILSHDEEVDAHAVTVLPKQLHMQDHVRDKLLSM